MWCNMGCQLPTCRSQDPSDCIDCEHDFEVLKINCDKCGKETSHARRKDGITACMICGRNADVSEDSKNLRFPALRLKCNNGHEWDIVIAPWYFNIDDMGRECSVCKGKAEVAKWGGMQPMK